MSQNNFPVVNARNTRELFYSLSDIVNNARFDRKKIAHCTYISYFEDDELERCVGVQYQATPIFAVWPSGDYLLNTGGWKTVTTKRRFNDISVNWLSPDNSFGKAPWHIYQKNHLWYITFADETYEFKDNAMMLDSFHNIIEQNKFVFANQNITMLNKKGSRWITNQEAAEKIKTMRGSLYRR